MRFGSQQGDFSRILFEPREQFRGVWMQQGRVQLDSDWNAQVTLLDERMDLQMVDLVGGSGGPAADCGYRIEPAVRLLFDGDDDLVEVAPAAELDFSGTRPFTLAARVRPAAGGGPVLSRLAAHDGAHDGAAPRGYQLRVLPDGRLGFLRGQRGDDGGAGGAGGELISQRRLAWGETAWVAVTFDGEQVRLWIDGETVAEGESGAAAAAPEASLLLGSGRQIGVAGGGEAMSFHGLLADVEVWAACRPEVAAGGGELPGGGAVDADPDLVARWPLDEREGVVAGEDGGRHPGLLGGGRPSAVPRRRAVEVVAGAGRYYVDGVLCRNFRPLPLSRQPLYPCLDALPAGSGRWLVYLDVWERSVNWIEDPRIREVALGGPDTTTHNQTVPQVRLHELPADLSLPAAADGAALLDAVGLGPPRSRLRARKQGGQAVGNRLYRVEVHFSGDEGNAEDAGSATDGGGVPLVLRVPTFKWSRTNASVVYPIQPLEGDGRSITLVDPPPGQPLPQPGDWLEIVDHRVSLCNLARRLVQVRRVDAETLRLELSEPAPRGVGRHAAGHPFLRLWDQRAESQGADLVGGTVPIQPGRWVELEDGIQVSFDGDGPYRTGDYWWIPSRTLIGGIEWPRVDDEPVARPADGVLHRRAPLALLEVDGHQVSCRDLRRCFPGLTAVAPGGAGREADAKGAREGVPAPAAGSEDAGVDVRGHGRDVRGVESTTLVDVPRPAYWQVSAAVGDAPANAAEGAAEGGGDGEGGDDPAGEDFWSGGDGNATAVAEDVPEAASEDATAAPDGSADEAAPAAAGRPDDPGNGSGNRDDEGGNGHAGGNGSPLAAAAPPAAPPAGLVPPGACVLSAAPLPASGWEVVGLTVLARPAAAVWRSLFLELDDAGPLLGAVVLDDAVRLVTPRAVWRWVPGSGAAQLEGHLPVVRGGAVAALDGRLYVVGGADADGSLTSRVDVYDPRRRAWETAAPLGEPRADLALAVAGGCLYAVGGRAAGGLGGRLPGRALDSVEIYDPAADDWRRGAPLPAGRADAAAVSLHGEASGDVRLWLLGGSFHADGSKDGGGWLYDAAENAWQPWFGVGPRRAAAAVAAGGEAWVVGGRVQKSWLREASAYDVSSGRWGRRLLPQAVERPAAVVWDGAVVVVGRSAGRWLAYDLPAAVRLHVHRRAD